MTFNHPYPPLATREELADRIVAALDIAGAVSSTLRLPSEAGLYDDARHKMWVIDQMVRVLVGNDEAYEKWIESFEYGEDGPHTYKWDKGIAP